jgi:general secretion pathway protein E
MAAPASQLPEEVTLELPAATAPAAPAAAAAGPRLLPFPFAKRHGVLVLGCEDGRAQVLARPGTQPLAIAEARRCVGMPLELQLVSSEEFDARLQETYERESSSTMQMVEGGLEDDTDLTCRLRRTCRNHRTSSRAMTTRRSSA